jgi:hypothetical protein
LHGDLSNSLKRNISGHIIILPKCRFVNFLLTT